MTLPRQPLQRLLLLQLLPQPPLLLVRLALLRPWHGLRLHDLRLSSHLLLVMMKHHLHLLLLLG
jgi:hypothetical protein